MAVLRYLLKLKRSLGLAFGANFLHKNVPYLILYQLTKIQCHSFFLLKISKQNALSSYLDNS